MAVAQAQTEIRPQQPPPALSVGVMGLYIFLASEVMFFGTLFAAYAYLVGSHGQWPPAFPAGSQPVPVWPLPTINTFVLISSGVTCHFGLEALRHGRRLGTAGIVAGALLVGFVVADVVCAIVAAVGGASAFEVSLAVFGALVQLVCAGIALGLGPFTSGRAVFFGLWIGTIILGAAFEAGQIYEFLTAGIGLTTNIFTSAFFTMTGFHGLHVAGGLVLLLLILGRALRGQFSSRHHVGPAAITLYWHFVDVVWIFLWSILYFFVAFAR
ncbi:MAG: heme-copper oxidase subunit III [Candidatus Dormibacteraeota bacterium]|nr:heme-copper oxidase subunit III [Candidatus Dormibacteraeota bacterium]